MHKRVSIDLASVHVLVVDDQAFIRGLLRGMLSRLGVKRMTLAGSGEQALVELAKLGRSVGCIISDWSMSPIDGLELLAAIRRGQVGDVPHDLPFILVSGYSTANVVGASRALDVSAYLVKPVSIAKLHKALTAAIKNLTAIKGADAYRAVSLPASPAQWDKVSVRPEAWRRWVQSGRPVILNDDKQFIQREGVSLNPAPEAIGAEIQSVRLKPVAKIKVGDVLVEDFCEADGTVLLHAGTVLSQRLLQRLATFKTSEGDEIKLWVGRHPKLASA